MGIGSGWAGLSTANNLINSLIDIYIATMSTPFNLKDSKFKEILNNNVEDKFIVILIENDGQEGIIRIDRAGFRDECAHLVSAMSIKEWDLLNGKYLTGNMVADESIDSNRISVTFPANAWDITKCRPVECYNYRETPDMYKEVTLKNIVPQDRSRIAWVGEILNGTKEADRVILNTDDFVLLPDLKWNPEEANAMYCVGIFKDTNLRSIRDLRAEHGPMLERARKEIEETIHKAYGINKRFIRIYFHYMPSYWQLHCHVTMNVKKDIGSSMDKSHLIEDVIGNMSMVPDFFSKADLTVRIFENQNEMFELYLRNND